MQNLLKSLDMNVLDWYKVALFILFSNIHRYKEINDVESLSSYWKTPNEWKQCFARS